MNFSDAACYGMLVAPEAPVGRGSSDEMPQQRAGGGLGLDALLRRGAVGPGAVLKCWRWPFI